MHVPYLNICYKVYFALFADRRTLLFLDLRGAGEELLTLLEGCCGK